MNKHTHAFAVFFLFLPFFSFATNPKLAPPVTRLGGTLQDFVYLLIKIIQAVAIPVLAVCIIYAGYLLVTAGGNEQQVSKAKLWIFSTLIGAAIILGARVIADAVFGTASLF